MKIHLQAFGRVVTAFALGACASPSDEDFVHGYELALTAEQQNATRVRFREEYTYERTDANGDGLIDLQEYNAYEWALREMFDLDGDGSLDRLEYVSSRVAPSPRGVRNVGERTIDTEFSALDDGPRDGRITHNEYAALTTRSFRANDADCRDGFLDRVDMSMDGDVSTRRCPAVPIRQ